MASAITRAAVVFASPGTLSMRMWPPLSNPINSDSRRCSCPTTLAENASLNAATVR